MQAHLAAREAGKIREKAEEVKELAIKH